MAERIVKVGLVGFGTVGSGVAKLITENTDLIAAKTGVRLNLACVVDIDVESDRSIILQITVHSPPPISSPVERLENSIFGSSLVIVRKKMERPSTDPSAHFKWP